MKNFEIEYKWSAAEPRSFYKMRRAMAGAGIAATSQTLHLRDVYLDTPSGELGAQKIAFRLRSTNGAWEATFKTKTEVINGKAVRREETLPLPAARSFRHALRLLHEKKRWKGLVLEGLATQFEIRNRRVLHLIKQPGFSAEISFDNCNIVVGKQRVIFKEIEMEFKRGRIKSFEQTVRLLHLKSGLKFSKCSKVKTAISLLKANKK